MWVVWCIDVAIIFFGTGASGQGAPPYRGTGGPIVFQGAHFALVVGPNLLQWALAGMVGPGWCR